MEEPKGDDSREFRYLPVTLHLETAGGVATPLVLRGTPLPAERVLTFATADDNQSVVEMKLLVGESPVSSRNARIGTLRLENIPPAPAGQHAIEITVRVDRHYLVAVKAAVRDTEVKMEGRTRRAQKLLDSEEPDVIIKRAEATRTEDEAYIARTELRLAAAKTLASAEARVKAKPTSADVASLNQAIASLGQALDEGSDEKISAATSTLQGQIAAAEKADSEALNRSLNASMLGSFFGAPGAPFSGSPRTPAASATARRRPVSATTSGAPTGAPRPTTQPIVVGKVFGGGQFALDPQLCFVLMPFAEDLRPVYEDHIRKVVKAEGLTCQRADDLAGPTSITTDIWERINRARFLIADLTRQNPNVFYELGIAHALSKDVVLLAQSLDFVPFDLKAIRVIEYQLTPRGMKAMEERLRNAVRSVMQSA